MSSPRPLRTHQAQTAAIVHAIADGHAPEITDILAAVTPGGGKSLLPVIAAHALLAARLVERVCWVVPRDSLRQQAEEAFADPAWRRTLGHAVSVRAADNAPDPCPRPAGLRHHLSVRGRFAPDLHLAEFRRHRTLLVLDEVHHLPALTDMAPDPLADPAAPDIAASWSRALLPLLETARLRLLLSGTLQRADGRSILVAALSPRALGSKRAKWTWPHRAGRWSATRVRKLWPSARCCPCCSGPWTARQAGWMRTGCTDRPAPVRPRPGRWRPPALPCSPPCAPALPTQLLREAFTAVRTPEGRPAARAGDLPPVQGARGLGKLLVVVATDQANARRYADLLRGWVPRRAGWHGAAGDLGRAGRA